MPTFDALAIPQAGGPVTRISQTVEPVDDEILVHVDYASLNRMDSGLQMRNVFQFPEPYVLGFDFSGEVARDSGEYKTGDRIFGRRERGGCFAQMAVVKPRHVMRRGAIPAAEASTYGIAYLTAYESIVMAADVARRAGEWIFIPGAGGGVGHFATQLARLHGLKVIGTAGKPESLAVLRKLGVEAVIDHSKEDVVAEVRKLTGGQGAALVYDSTCAQASFERSAAALAPGGTFVRLGTDEQLARFGVADIAPAVEARGAKLVVADLGRYQREPELIARLPEVALGQRRAIGWYEEAKLRPVITGTVPFEAAALQQALDDFRAGKNNAGKIVVRCR